MKIERIKIENFKAFKTIEIPCNSSFNFIIGENNIGKSTLFEAIQLWKLGFDSLVQLKGKDFYGKTTARYLPIDYLYFLRITGINDIFNTSGKDVSITLTISCEEEVFGLKINFEKPASIDVYLRVKYDGVDFIRFSEKVKNLGLNLKNSIFIYQTKPIFYAVKHEPFYNNAQLLKKISLGKSQEVLRNKILKGDPTERKFTRLEERLSNVFSQNINIKFKNRTLQDEEFVRINVQFENGKETDISLMGSGTLQIIDIFSTVEYVNKKEHCLNILLIDEPDSHIHANLQSNLIDELRKIGDNQHFVITHNDRLINKAEENEILFINKKSLSEGILDFLPKSSYSSIAVELSSSLFSLSEEERQKIIVVTEGKTDKKIIETAWNKLFPNVNCPFKIIASGIYLEATEKKEGNADQVRRSIEFISTIYSDLRLVGLFDNDREGYCQFKGLNNSIFEDHNFASIKRKHRNKDIYGMVLPYPVIREQFITQNDENQRYFVIEHYFSNEVLEYHQMKGSNILGTSVFNIGGNKNTFSNSVANLGVEHFGDFNLLFNALNALFV